MAEPRKPRVIKTRPGASRPNPAPPAPVEEKPTGSSSATPAQGAKPAAGATPTAGAVRSTSSKVSVQSLATPATEAATLAKKAATPATGTKAPAPAVKSPSKAGKAPAPGAKAPRKSAKAPGSKAPAAGAKAAGVKAPASVSGTSEAGAQVLAFPLPPHKVRRRNIIYGTAGIVVVLALVMGFALFSPALAVKTVVFDGRKLVAEERLQAALAPLIGTPLPQITEEQVQDLLKPVVQVKSAVIEARPPSTLLVRVVERVPVALLKNDEDFLMVDQDGVELGATKDPASVALPLIDGGKAAIGQDTFTAMTSVLANLPHSILEQLANATAASPDAVELKLVDGRSVIWGDASDMDLKAQVLEALLNAPPPTAPAGKPEPAPVQVFDVSAPRHPVTR